ncbi:hypothetical protein EON67_02525 [archaeon]|nr:MAG: hypothetical protein EON67_02525 [archaeon]
MDEDAFGRHGVCCALEDNCRMVLGRLYPLSASALRAVRATDDAALRLTSYACEAYSKLLALASGQRRGGGVPASDEEIQEELLRCVTCSTLFSDLCDTKMALLDDYYAAVGCSVLVVRPPRASWRACLCASHHACARMCARHTPAPACRLTTAQIDTVILDVDQRIRCCEAVLLAQGMCWGGGVRMCSLAYNAATASYGTPRASAGVAMEGIALAQCRVVEASKACGSGVAARTRGARPTASASSVSSASHAAWGAASTAAAAAAGEDVAGLDVVHLPTHTPTSARSAASMCGEPVGKGEGAPITRGVGTLLAPLSAASVATLNVLSGAQVAVERVHRLVSTALAADAAKQQEKEMVAAASAQGTALPSEPLYCSCRQVAFGDMIACDNPDCPTEWYHCACMGITQSSMPNTKWYCPTCAPAFEVRANEARSQPAASPPPPPPTLSSRRRRAGSGTDAVNTVRGHTSSGETGAPMLPAKRAAARSARDVVPAAHEDAPLAAAAPAKRPRR